MTIDGMRAYRAGVVGAGRISEEHLSFLARCAGIEVVAVCDLDPLLAGRAARIHQATSFIGLDDMLDKVELDAVHILTPPRHHRAAVSAAIEASVGLIIVEKPAALDIDDVDAMVEEASRAEVTLTEDHNYLFNRPVVQLVSLIESGRLGEMRDVEVRMAMPLGKRTVPGSLDSRDALMPEFLPHLAYLIGFFVPDAFVIDRRWEKMDREAIADPDNLVAEVRSSTTSVTGRAIFQSNVAPATTSITVRGSEGWAVADLQRAHLMVSTARSVGPQLSGIADQGLAGMGLVGSAFRGVSDKLHGSPIYSGIGEFLRRTYRAHRRGTTMPVGPVEMIRSARLMGAMLEGNSR